VLARLVDDWPPSTPGVDDAAIAAPVAMIVVRGADAACVLVACSSRNLFWSSRARRRSSSAVAGVAWARCTPSSAAASAAWYRAMVWDSFPAATCLTTVVVVVVAPVSRTTGPLSMPRR